MGRRRTGFTVPKTVRLRESAPVVEASGEVDRDKLKRYWTQGKGKARWVGHPHPWRELYGHLKDHMPDEMAKRVASEWYHEVLGRWPGEKKESAAPERAAVRISEAGSAGAMVATGSGRRWRARIIQGDRWGSSGYYGRGVLERDGKIFENAPIFADHPGATEEADRPERSIRDLAGRIVSKPTYVGDGLYADVEIFPHMADMVAALAETIGLSIRASGLAEIGTVDGRTGPVITELSEAYSVDLVTKAGAGGALVSLLESARQQNLAEARNVGAWIESRLHLALTQMGDEMYGDGRLTRDERITLSGAIGDALTAWTARVEADAPQLFQRDLYDEPGPAETPVAESATPPEPAPEAEPDTSASAPPAAPENPPIQEEPSMSGSQTAGVAPGAQAGQTPTVAGAPNVDAVVVSEAKRQVAEMQLVEAKTQAEGLRTQLTEAQKATALAEARADKAEAELRTVKAVEAARTQATDALASSDLPAVARTRVIESVTRNVALTDAGVVDTAALTASITAAVDAEKAYIASVSESAGAGTPTGLGTAPAPLTESTTTGDAGNWEAATAARLARIGGYKTAAIAGKAV